jgi:hypothetical protein
MKGHVAKMRLQGVRENMEVTVILRLPRSLVAPLGRSAAASVTCTRIRAKAYGMNKRGKKRTRRCRFSIGSAP